MAASMHPLGIRPPARPAIHDVPPPANTDHIKRKLLDIPYAHLSPAQRLDIYLPDEGEGPFPVILSIHGGAFMMGDKADVQLLPFLEGLKRGYAVVAVNYRLSWEARFPALIHDVKAAVRWIRANAGRYHLDPARIAAWGGSAGGYLASMLGVSAGIPEIEDLNLGNPEQPCSVQVVVAWFGPTDFGKMDEQLAEWGLASPELQPHDAPDSPESLLLGDPLSEVPEHVQEANPETYIRPGAPPFLLQHGTRDVLVPPLQSIHFAEKLAEVLGGDRVTLELLEGAGHADPQFERPENVARVLDFLDRCLK